MEGLSSKFVLIAETIGIATLVLVIYRVVSFYLYVKRMSTAFKGVKSPENYHWLIGHLPCLPKDGHERAMYFLHMANKYGSEDGYMMLWATLRLPLIIPCSPKVLGTICKSNEPKPVRLFGNYRLVKPWLGDGLILSSGSKWARNRRLLTPAFHFEILKPYVKVFNNTADVLVEKISQKAESGERFEIYQNVCLCTLDIILKCAFSYNNDVQIQREKSPYVQAVNRLSDSIFVRTVNPLKHIDFIYYRTSAGRQFKKDCDYVHAVSEEIIEKRKKELATEKDTDVKDKRYVDFLDILLTAKDDTGVGLTQKEIREEVDNFLFAGHDTTATGISWILYSLALNPEWQQKCQKEIDQVLEGRDTDDLEWADLSKLECLTMCIKEGMRLYPPVPILTRETKDEFIIGDRVFPPGILVQINVWVMNHMENVWGPDHWEFKPERFSKDNCAKMAMYQFVPFSAGPRNCIGKNFATNEEKVVLSKLLRNFTFTVDTSHEVRLNIATVMRTQNGVYMFAEKRTHKR